MEDLNGSINCVLRSSWKETSGKVSEMHTAIKTMTEYLPHLSKLDALEDVKEHLMKAATGRDQLETKTAMAIFKILGVVIFGLLAVIVYLLTSGHVKIPMVG